MNNNICMFPPKYERTDSFHILNYVYEANCSKEINLKSNSTFRFYFITAGFGKIHTANGVLDIVSGDMFLMPPAIPFSIENTGDIKYIYITYTGVRANYMADFLKIGRFGEIYRNYDHLRSLWESLFDIPMEIAAFRCESILLYSFSEISKNIFEHSLKHTPIPIANEIKKYIDDNFADSELNLNFLSKKFSYHPKYLSNIFKKEFKISITDYIRTIRIQYACTLMEQGFSLLKDISTLCGFKDSHYFSNVFKTEMGISPKEHIQFLHQEKE